ncbi:uncharacterized protein LOC117647181 isoform X2 [Thrips palmi]|uniref:Uncharacterized protein LOC117647181 isoform X2 n=1 Tax=Thrips palmi TaxID=161013 RepID=A0A6P8Z4J1_THRPL|nr:uncharacterized protein LOC117647181 isoform X2 [Thrips palmi]XP_034244692.1 uncharacterized protein LOC117647181 isoform X2 [Thrips palmi]XP_034244693.1 uncharacterized protein LOC117647181 isoform X2 [Thrips palmi]
MKSPKPVVPTKVLDNISTNKSQVATSTSTMNTIPKLWLWCRDCSMEAVESCADDAHSLCSLRTLRAEQAAPKFLQLRDAKDFANGVLKALRESKDILQNQIDEWEAKLEVMAKGECELQAAVDKCEDPATVPLEGLQHVEEVARMLTARWCEIQLVMKNDATEWRWPISSAEVRLLTMIVLQLRQNGNAFEVHLPDSGPLQEVSSRATAVSPGFHVRQSAAVPDSVNQVLLDW